MHRPNVSSRLRRVIGFLFVLGAILSPVGVSGQTAADFVLTGAVRQCNESIVNLTWSGGGTLASLTISASNTSSNWSDQVTITSPTGNSYAYEFDHHAVDKVVVTGIIDGIIPFVYQYQANVGTCGVSGAISGGLQGDNSGHPDILITISDVTCTGFNWTVSAPFTVVVYPSTHDILGRSLAPMEPQTGTNLSGSTSYVIENEMQTNFNILLAVHDPSTNEELARKSISKECPIATETPSVTPDVTPSVTPDVDERTRVIIQIDMPGGASIEGAPYSVFAPMAAQFAVEPYVQGAVGPENTIVLFDLIAGQYRLVVEPEGMDPFEVVFTVGPDQVTEILVAVDADGNASVVTNQVVPTSTAVPDSEKSPATGDAVSGLPTTGYGESRSATPIFLFALAAAVMSIASLAVVRKVTVKA